MVKQTNTEDGRRKALGHIRQLHAILILAAQMDQDWVRLLDDLRMKTVQADAAEITAIEEWAASKVASARSEYGIKVNSEVLSTFFDQVRGVRPDEMHFIRKQSLSEMLSHYDALAVPSHWQIGLDVKGRLGRKFPDLRMRILEASLYEDMAALFNLAHESAQREEENKASKRPVKTAIALRRACAVAAYHFVEGYLNGIAFDHLSKMRTSLDKSTVAYLSEWDADANKPRWVKTRDKLVNYPRLILGLDHPPLQENNCPEIKTFLEHTKLIRDALSHPSPSLDGNTLEPAKEYAIFNFSIEALPPIVDSAVAVVEVLERLLVQSRDRILWLYGRSENGLFPDSAFE